MGGGGASSLVLRLVRCNLLLALLVSLLVLLVLGVRVQGKAKEHQSHTTEQRAEEVRATRGGSQAKCMCVCVPDPLHRSEFMSVPNHRGEQSEELASGGDGRQNERVEPEHSDQNLHPTANGGQTDTIIRLLERDGAQLTKIWPNAESRENTTIFTITSG